MATDADGTTEFISLGLIMVIHVLPGTIRDTGVIVPEQGCFSPRSRACSLTAGGTKVICSHLRQGFLAAKMAVVFDHLAVGVANPLSDLAFRSTTQKALADKKMSERVQAAVLKADVHLGCGILGLKFVDHLANEHAEWERARERLQFRAR